MDGTYALPAPMSAIRRPVAGMGMEGWSRYPMEVFQTQFWRESLTMRGTCELGCWRGEGGMAVGDMPR